MLVDVSADKARIYRIIHRENIDAILDHGIVCRNDCGSCNYVTIGLEDLIDRRKTHPVKVPPGGCLGDYVPFYFTYASIMLRKIYLGDEVLRRPNADIVFLVSSLYKLKELGLPFLFTDNHASTLDAVFYNDLGSLDKIDWAILQRRDFRRSLDDPGKLSRYQAEALVYKKVPFDGLLGIACHNVQVKEELEQAIGRRGLKFPDSTGLQVSGF